MSPSLVFKIARREYLARVRSRAFVLMTVLVPAFLGMYMLAVPLLGRSSSKELRIAVLDAGTGLGASVGERLRAIERPHITVTETSSIEAVDAAARAPFERGDSRSNARRLSDASSAPMRRRREPATLRAKRAIRC